MRTQTIRKKIKNAWLWTLRKIVLPLTKAHLWALEWLRAKVEDVLQRSCD